MYSRYGAVLSTCFGTFSASSGDTYGNISKVDICARVPQRFVGARRTPLVARSEAVLAMFFFPVIGLTAGAVMLGTFAVCWPLALLNAPPKERKTVRPKVRKDAVTEPPKPRKPVLKVVK